MEELILQNLLSTNFDAAYWSRQVGRRIRRTTVAGAIDHGYITGVDWSDTVATSDSAVLAATDSAADNSVKTAVLSIQFVNSEMELLTGASTAKIFAYPDYMGAAVNERNCVGKFDYVILGGGPTGLSAAEELAKLTAASVTTTTTPTTPTTMAESKSICVLEWKKILGGRPGHRMVGKTNSQYYLDKTSPKVAEHSRAKFSGYAACAQQPIDWVCMYWIRELFFWSVVGAIFVPGTSPFRAVVERIFLLWLDYMQIISTAPTGDLAASASSQTDHAGSADGVFGVTLEDVEFASQFRLPDERNQILSISETIVAEVFPVEEVGSREVAKTKFLTSLVVQNGGLFESKTGRDMWRVIGEVTGLDGMVLMNLVRASLGKRLTEKEIREAVNAAFSGGAEEGDWVNLRTSEEEASDEGKREALIERLVEMTNYEAEQDHEEVEKFDVDKMVTSLSENPDVTLLTEAIVHAVELVHVVGGTTTEEVVRIWFKRRGCLRFVLARGVVVALPFTSATQNLQIYDPKNSELHHKIRKFSEFFAAAPDTKHFVYRVEKMAERPIPVEWRIPGEANAGLPAIRSWRELFQANGGVITWTSTNAKFRFVELVDEDEEDADWLVHCELPAFIATPNAKRDCRSFLQALLPGLKLSDGTLVEVDNLSGRLAPSDGFDLEQFKAMVAQVSDQRLALAGEFATPNISLLGTVAGAVVSGRTQAANLVAAVSAAKGEVPEGMENTRQLLTYSVQSVGTTSVGRMLSEDRKRIREEAGSSVVPSIATGTHSGRRPGRGEVDLPRHLITAHLMRNISVMSDGWKYRKETRDFKVYLPKRPKLSQVVRDKRLVLAIMAQFPDKLARLNAFNELVKSTPEYAEGDPYPLALQVFEAESIELPDVETIAFENMKGSAAKDEGEGEGEAGGEEAEAVATEEPEWSEEPSEGEEDEMTETLLINQAGGAIRKHNGRFRTNFAYGRSVYDMPWRSTMRDAARDWWVLRTVIDALETPAQKRFFINSYQSMTGRIVIPQAVTDPVLRRRIRKFMTAQLNMYVRNGSESPAETDGDVEMKGDEESVVF